MPFKSDLSRRIAQFQNKVKRSTLEAKRATALELSEKLIDRTPIADPETAHPGQARNNWNTSINVNDTTFTPGPDPSEGENAKARAAVVAEQLQLGERFIMTNTTSYIGALEQGSSSQAPAGFLALTLAEMNLVFSRNFKAQFRYD